LKKRGCGPGQPVKRLKKPLPKQGANKKITKRTSSRAKNQGERVPPQTLNWVGKKAAVEKKIGANKPACQSLR